MVRYQEKNKISFFYLASISSNFIDEKLSNKIPISSIGSKMSEFINMYLQQGFGNYAVLLVLTDWSEFDKLLYNILSCSSLS